MTALVYFQTVIVVSENRLIKWIKCVSPLTVVFVQPEPQVSWSVEKFEMCFSLDKRRTYHNVAEIFIKIYSNQIGSFVQILNRCFPFFEIKETHQIVSVPKNSLSMKFTGIVDHGIWAQLVHLLHTLLELINLLCDVLAMKKASIPTAIRFHAQAIRSIQPTFNHTVATMSLMLITNHVQTDTSARHQTVTNHAHNIVSNILFEWIFREQNPLIWIMLMKTFWNWNFVPFVFWHKFIQWISITRHRNISWLS